jgi:hypothetical protein
MEGLSQRGHVLGLRVVANLFQVRLNHARVRRLENVQAGHLSVYTWEEDPSSTGAREIDKSVGIGSGVEATLGFFMKFIVAFSSERPESS